MLRANAMALAALVSATVLPASARAAWVNETGLPQEADYVVLQFPSSLNVSAGTLTPLVYGQIYEAGATESLGPNLLILADVGYGPLGSDPRVSLAWNWFPAIYNAQIGNNDEYQASLLSPLINGTYSYTYRFSVDAGANLTAADLDGAGSNPGLDFDPSKLGVLTVTGGSVPEPTSLTLLSLGILALCARAGRR